MHALLYHYKSNKTKSGIIFEEYYTSVLEKAALESDFLSKCRICLREGSISIHNNVCKEEIVRIIECFGNIHINEDDDYPKQLCTMCYKFVKSAVSFQRAAKHIDGMLKQHVSDKSNIFEQSEDFLEYSNGSVHEEDTLKESDKVQVIKKRNVKSAIKVTCHICNKVINRSYYKEHVTMHDPDHKKYVCDVCGKSFRLRCAYHNHSLRHRSDFPYKCQFCPYRGRYAELLKTHMRTHTGDYRYMCTECPARFLFKSNLNSHMMKHKEPKFKCDACKRAFHTKLTLQRHFEADHLGIKNHVCGMCGKAFGYRNAMMKHQRHVHKREKQLFGRMPAYLQADCINRE